MTPSNDSYSGPIINQKPVRNIEPGRTKAVVIETAPQHGRDIVGLGFRRPKDRNFLGWPRIAQPGKASSGKRIAVLDRIGQHTVRAERDNGKKQRCERGAEQPPRTGHR